MNEIQVSFIVPVFNGQRYMERCLHAILSQDFPRPCYELLVIDNGSTDSTHEVLKRFAVPFEVLPRQTVSALRNFGAKKARGQFLAFVDSDVEIELGWLQRGLAVFQDPTVVAAGCFPGVPADATWVQRAWDLHQSGRDPRRALRRVFWLSSMNLIVRTTDFASVGGFHEQLQTSEDVDLCYRLGQQGTLLLNPGMRAVHWGEAGDLETFWRKEVWRGIGGSKGILSHGLRWDELPSLLYPIWMLGLTLLAAACIGTELYWRARLWSSALLVLLTLPAAMLALLTSWQSRRFDLVHQLFVLYLLYGFARGWSLVKAWVAR